MEHELLRTAVCRFVPGDLVKLIFTDTDTTILWYLDDYAGHMIIKTDQAFVVLGKHDDFVSVFCSDGRIGLLWRFSLERF